MNIFNNSTCWTSIPLAHTSVVMSTRDCPDLNSFMMASLSFWGMSPCMDDTVKLASRIFSVNQSTLRLVLQKMTACKMENKSLVGLVHCWIYNLSVCSNFVYLCDSQRVVKIAESIKLPLLPLDCDEELFDALKCQLVTFDQDPDRVCHELGCHL